MQHSRQKVVILFEGRDAAGKGGVIKRITQRLNPRVARVAALPAPNDRERTQWYFQRYVAHLPAAGEIVLFDRSWYNRAGVERVMGFCTDDEYEEFFRTVPEFERMLVRSGIKLIKYWFSITDEEQHMRFLGRIHDPLKQWKLSPMDLESRRRWEEYTKAKETMLERTHIPEAPWWVVQAVDKKKARLNCISHLLGQMPYHEVPHPPIDAAGAGAQCRLPAPAGAAVDDTCPRCTEQPARPARKLLRCAEPAIRLTHAPWPVAPRPPPPRPHARLPAQPEGAHQRHAAQRQAHRRAGARAPRAKQLKPPRGPGDWLSGVALGPGGARRYHLYRPPDLPGRRDACRSWSCCTAAGRPGATSRSAPA